MRHLENPDFGAVFFRRVGPELRNEGGMWDESHKLYPHCGGEGRDSSLTWTFPMGSRIKFSHMQYEADKKAWAGSQIPLICFDQLESFESSMFWFLLSRNRSMCGVRPYIRATVNPDPDSFVAGLVEWWIDQETGLAIPERSGVVRYFIRELGELHWGDTPEELVARWPTSLPKSFTFIPATIHDNKKLMEADPSYIANLQALTLVERERLLSGNWKIRPSGGKVFNRAWFPVVPTAPAALSGHVRYWDKAGTPDGGDWTVGVLMAKGADGLFYVLDVVRGQWGSADRERVIQNTTNMDGRGVTIWLEQEPGSGGKESAEMTIKRLAGHTAFSERKSGSKYENARPLAAQVQAGNIRLVEAPWNKSFVEELHNFSADTGNQTDDQVDAAAGAFNKVATVVPWRTRKVSI